MPILLNSDLPTVSQKLTSKKRYGYSLPSLAGLSNLKSFRKNDSYSLSTKDSYF